MIKLDMNSGVYTMEMWMCLDEAGPVLSLRTLLRSLIPPVPVFKDCVTVSLDGEFLAACNSLRSVTV